MWRIAWRIFRGLGAIQHWARRSFTSAGIFVIGAATLAAAFGVDTNQNLAYKIFAALVALLAVAWIARRFQNGRFAVRRELPRAVTAGEPFEYRVRVRNLGNRRVEGARLVEEPDDPRPSFDVFRSEARRPTYAQWWWVREKHRVARLGEPALPPMEPNEEVVVRASVRTYRRGRLRLAACAVAITEPLGLARRAVPVAAQDQVLVLPRRYKLPRLALPGGRRYQAGGITLSSAIGDSEECAGLRDYRPGDPMQRVHWKSFARRGKPVVREFQDEYFQRHALVLDTFCAPAGDEAFEEAVAVAASLAQTIDTQECLLDLMFVGAESYTFTAGRGQMQPDGLLGVLAGVAPCRDRPFAQLRDAVRARRAAMTGALMILLAWDRERRDFIEEMRSLGLAMRVVVVANGEVDAPPWVKVLHPGRVQEGLATL